MQQDSPIPMQDQDENKNQPPINAIEIHYEGLQDLYSVIKKQQARDMKKQLQQIELEKTDYESDKKNE